MNKIDTKYHHPTDQITEIIKRIYNARLTTTSGGNISIKDSEGNIWITPSAIDKGSLRPSDIVCVRKDGTIIGRHKPSSEFPFHKAIYEVRPELRSVIHAHPPALVSFSIVREIPITNIIPQARHICGPIGYANYSLPGGEELGIEIAREFKQDYNAVIMENHGCVIGGYDIKDAYIRFETLEFAARTIINAKMIGKPRYLSDAQIDAFESQIPEDLPELSKIEHNSDELQIRKEISQLVKRACHQGLMIGSYGTVSVRFGNDAFLITPRNVPRWEIDIEDIVLIQNGKREKGKLPSRAVKLHEEIYKKNPKVNSIILTQPPDIMAFGVTKTKLDVRTIPESWIFLQDIPVIKFGDHFFNNDTISHTISTDSPALLIQNDSFVVTGDKLLNTFDRLEVAEFSAKSLIMANPLGDLFPINEEQIEELRKKFLS